MSKPTLFFSHSSKDMDMVLAIKNKVMKYTSGTLEIFQSSDGESIPFGANWIHKVEEGLKEAKVMFVFITEQSISSGWIYFEAGYAYSKDVHVIPVGIGVNVGDLKAPLNLLQGFNITSEDSLNNFLTIINREFNYSFPAQFTNKDYYEIQSLGSAKYENKYKFESVIKSICCVINGSYIEQTSAGISHAKTIDTRALFCKTKSYLDKNNISYSLSGTSYKDNSSGKSRLSVGGILFDYLPYRKNSEYGDIEISISPYCFEKSFDLYLKILKELDLGKRSNIQLKLNDKYSYITNDVDLAAILSTYPQWFMQDCKMVGGFICDKWDIKFKIYDLNTSRLADPDYVMGLSFNRENITADDINNYVSKLLDATVIQRRKDEKTTPNLSQQK